MYNKRSFTGMLLVGALAVSVFLGGCGSTAGTVGTTESTDSAASEQPTAAQQASTQQITDSPEWVQNLPQAQDESVSQLFVVGGMGMDLTTASVSMHERDENGNWKQILSTPGYVGKYGLCLDEDHAEGCGQTPVGVYHFNKAFGIADDPGCALPYTQVDEDIYWSGDENAGMHYNEMVDIKDYPDLDMTNSEHIIEYQNEYQYCLNISFNEDGIPGRGSAIFLHCMGAVKPFTGGCVAIPQNIMKQVMQNVREDCVVVIDTLDNMGFSFYAPAEEALSLWTEDAEAKSSLISYMETITDESSADFIPVENRIAVFDLDGTLFCETDPNYFDYTLLVHRVLEDPDYVDQASDFEREVAQKIVEQNETGASFEGLETDHGKAVASAFAGMTTDEFNAYIREFKKLPMPSYDGMTRGEGWYQPMLQIVDYLKANDFTVYIVSGTDRFIVRGIVDGSPLNLPNSQIIGSDETVVTKDQGDEDGLDYVFDEDDEVILGGEFLIKNLKMNKVSVIVQEIGEQPVLSFGNSTGDSSMAEYVTNNNPYWSMAFMLCCDDTERENGNEEKADKMYSLCDEYGWVPISMKNDWTTIYGDGVVKK